MINDALSFNKDNQSSHFGNSNLLSIYLCIYNDYLIWSKQ